MAEVNGTMIKHLVDAYLGSRDFERVSASQDQYRYWLRVLCDTAFDDSTVGQVKFKKLTTPQAQVIYDTLSDRGITFANRITGVTRKMFNYAKKYGIVDTHRAAATQSHVAPPRCTQVP